MVAPARVRQIKSESGFGVAPNVTLTVPADVMFTRSLRVRTSAENTDPVSTHTNDVSAGGVGPIVNDATDAARSARSAAACAAMTFAAVAPTSSGGLAGTMSAKATV